MVVEAAALDAISKEVKMGPIRIHPETHSPAAYFHANSIYFKNGHQGTEKLALSLSRRY